MKKVWEMKSFSEIGNVYNGNSINAKIKKKNYYNLEEGIPYIATKDISFDCNIDYNNGIKIPFAEKTKFKIAPQHTALICAEGGSAGRKIGFTNKEVCFGNKLFAFSANNNVDSKYVYYYYFSSLFQQQFLTRMKGIIGGVSMSKFKSIQIPLPSHSEQIQIVSILDKAFTAIDKAKTNAEQNIKNATELFESYLNGVFENRGDGWEEKTLQQVSLIFGRGKSKHRPRNAKILYGGNYPFIQTGDIRNCNHDITTFSQTYSELGLAQSKLWPKGTICITIAANIAETGIISFDACFPDSVIGAIVNDKITTNHYVEYLLQKYKLSLQSLGKGSAQANINLATFKNLYFPFPRSLKEQKVIVEKLDYLSAETQKLETLYKKKLVALDELKKSILQKAFNGELDTSKDIIFE